MGHSHGYRSGTRYAFSKQVRLRPARQFRAARAPAAPPRLQPTLHRRPRRRSAALVALLPRLQFRTAGVNTHLTQYLTPLRVGDYVR